MNQGASSRCVRAELDVRCELESGLDLRPADRQQEGGFGMQVCSQPWVTANSRAASREANVVSNLNTLRCLSSPWERWTANEARKRPQSVGCVAGETTYLPMVMAVFEIVINQERRRESRLHEHGDSVGCCSACRPKGQRGRGAKLGQRWLSLPLWASGLLSHNADLIIWFLQFKANSILFLFLRRVQMRSPAVDPPPMRSRMPARQLRLVPEEVQQASQGEAARSHGGRWCGASRTPGQGEAQRQGGRAGARIFLDRRARQPSKRKVLQQGLTAEGHSPR